MAQEACADELNLDYPSPAATPDHPYLLKKHIKDVGPLKIDRGDLLVPVFNARTDEFQTYQRIKPDGKTKLFPKNAVKAGGYVLIGERWPTMEKYKGSRPIVICEGYATGYAIYKATFPRYTVVSALDRNNLTVVAEALHDRFPLRDFIIAADNDVDPDKPDDNPGIKGAMKAALAIGRKITVPPPGDFWDLWDKEGDAAVKKLIDEAVAPVAEQEEPPLEEEEHVVKKPLSAGKQRIARMLPWRERKPNGFPAPSMHNARLAITDMGIECSCDTFHIKMLLGYKGEAFKHELGDEITDNAIIRLRQLMSDRYCFDFTERHTRDAVISLALEHCFDPVCDMLDQAEAAWDGVKFISRQGPQFVEDYLGAIKIRKELERLCREEMAYAQ